LSTSCVVAQDADRRALAAILDDTHIVDAALPVHRQAASMSMQRRFEFPSQWVLPSLDHSSFRLALDFTPTNPAAAQRSDVHPADAQRLDQARSLVDSRVQLGGHMVSPAIDLIEAATQLGRLDDIRGRIADSPAHGDAQQRCRLALLALVDMARRDFDGAVASVELLSSR
jgi:hypothetical protein